MGYCYLLFPLFLSSSPNLLAFSTLLSACGKAFAKQLESNFIPILTRYFCSLPAPVVWHLATVLQKMQPPSSLKVCHFHEISEFFWKLESCASWSRKFLQNLHLTEARSILDVSVVWRRALKPTPGLAAWAWGTLDRVERALKWGEEQNFCLPFLALRKLKLVYFRWALGNASRKRNVEALIF